MLARRPSGERTRLPPRLPQLQHLEVIEHDAAKVDAGHAVEAVTDALDRLRVQTLRYLDALALAPDQGQSTARESTSTTVGLSSRSMRMKVRSKRGTRSVTNCSDELSSQGFAKMPNTAAFHDPRRRNRRVGRVKWEGAKGSGVSARANDLSERPQCS